MYQAIQCSHCKKEGTFPIEHAVRLRMVTCLACSHTSMIIWKYYFCSSTCFDLWLDQVRTEGLACRDCNGTGWLAGFESNGKCDMCEGKGSITYIV